MHMKKHSQESYQKQQDHDVYTNISSDIDVLRKTTARVINENRKLLYRLEKGELSFNYGGRPIRAVKSDIARVVSEWPQNNLDALTIRNIILNAILSSEMKSAGSGIITLQLLNKSYEHLTAKTRVEQHDAFSSLARHINAGIIYKIVKAIVTNGSINCSFSCVVGEKSNNFKIDIQPSLKLEGAPHEIFDVQIESLKNHAILIIDGVIEKVSEIDCLLRSCAEEDANLLLCARNFAPDVANTLTQNFKNKKLRVIPFKANVDMHVKELMLKSNIHVIDIDSSLSLSTLKINELSRSCDLLFNGNTMKIINGNGLDRHAKIEIPRYLKHHVGIIEDRIKYSLTMLLEAAKYGIVYDGNRPVCTVHAYKVAQKTSEGLKKSIGNLGCIISPEI